MNIKDDKDALEKFYTASIRYTELEGKENHKELNKNVSIIHKAAGFLKKNNKLINLKPILNDPNLGVASWAALYYLTIDEELAVQRLKEIIDAKIKFVSLSAEYILKQWEDGSLEIYFVE
jgi:hypothetical protein